MNSRAIAAKCIFKVIKQRVSLDSALENLDPQSKDYAFIKELCFGTLRWYHRLNKISDQLLLSPLPQKHTDILCLLLIGLYQIIYLNTPSHAAVSETVAATRELKKSWASALINKTLRKYLEQHKIIQKILEPIEEAYFSHPQWLIDELRKAWPQDYKSILKENNQRAPMTLRVNTQLIARDEYLKLLPEESLPKLTEAIELRDAISAQKLPGFTSGQSYIQDLAGQLAAHFIKPAANQRVLDACSAPGSKTTHILQLQSDLKELVALDISDKRLTQLSENLKRLRFNTNSIKLIAADASDLEAWWDGELFDSVLLDAPCSGTGVIRRHPDIKILRQKSDIQNQSELQAKLLKVLWPLIKPGGHLLYSTCSILPVENEDQISRFIDSHSDAQNISLNCDWAHPLKYGIQIFPGDNNADGFYYALMQKV